MAKISGALFHGLSGRVGDMVFRQRNGRTYVSALPKRRPPPPTARQVEQQHRFRAAASYASSALADPIMREFYTRMAAGQGNAHSIAMRDFFRPPEITLLDVSRYTGHTGDVILVEAIDDTGVATVKVEIRDQHATLLESGFARFAGAWIYRTTTQPSKGYPLTIQATARDHAGNQAQLSAPWIPPGYAMPSVATAKEGAGRPQLERPTLIT